MIRVFYPESIYKLLEALSEHKAYVVGGFVRDLLLTGHGGEFLSPQTDVQVKKDPEINPWTPSPNIFKDVDLVTADSLEKFLPTVQSLSPHYHVVQRYQAIEFSHEGYQITLTRLRHDSQCDGRHADVVFVDTLQEDSWRRDFTINALYTDKDGQVVDFLSGYNDLKHRNVRFIGDPETRIKEDVLRILRYVRFCSLLKTPLDKQLLGIMRPYFPKLWALPQDRLNRETKKIQKIPFGQKNLEQLM